MPRRWLVWIIEGLRFSGLAHLLKLINNRSLIINIKMNIYKNLSTLFFGCNYVGVLYGAFTFNTETNEDKKKVLLFTLTLSLALLKNSPEARLVHVQ